MRPPRRSLLASSTFRVTLVYTAVFTLAAMALMTFVYWSGAGFMSDQVDTTIEAEIEGLREQYEVGRLRGLLAAIDRRLKHMPTTTTIYLLRAPNGELIGGNLNRWPDLPRGEDGWVEFALRDPDEPESAAHRARSRVFSLPGSYGLLVGRDMAELDLVQRRLRRALGWGLVGMIVLGIAGGMLVSRGILRRIEAINRTSAEIVEGDLSRRIPTRGGVDDLDRLALNLNGMLDRIEALMASVRQVSDNIAHDLKTPLMRLRNRLEEMHRELASAGNRSDQRIELALADADTLLETFSALLRIARVESGQSLAFEKVDLRSVLADVAELYDPVAGERQIALRTDFDHDIAVVGDRNLLFQAFANLLDNAIKYTPAGGQVELQLRGRDGQVDGPLVAVRDTGPGIPAAEHDKVTRRFYRLDRSRSSPGSGLGLSLVVAVCRLHGMVLRFGPGIGAGTPAEGLGVELRWSRP